MNQAGQRGSNFRGPERRSRIRFPIELGARCTIVGRPEIEATGQTVNLGSHGLLMTCTTELPPGTLVGVVVEWPILLGSVHPLGLYIQGTVVRTDPGLIAVKFSIYELRTPPKPPHQVKGIQKWRTRNC